MHTGVVSEAEWFIIGTRVSPDFKKGLDTELNSLPGKWLVVFSASSSKGEIN